jgi:transcriptional regulator with XRE-family HTH domain
VAHTPFRDRLSQEFAARRRINRRFSLRAFALLLGVNHSTLSQILRGRRRIATRQVRRWGRVLGLEHEEIVVYAAAEHVSDPLSGRRQEQLRHWTAEALALVNQPAHLKILRLARGAEFRPDCRWLAEQTGIAVDEVNIALSRLLRLHLLAGDEKKWKDATGLPALTRAAFRKLALARARRMAIG